MINAVAKMENARGLAHPSPVAKGPVSVLRRMGLASFLGRQNPVTGSVNFINHKLVKFAQPVFSSYSTPRVSQLFPYSGQTLQALKKSFEAPNPRGL